MQRGDDLIVRAEIVNALDRTEMWGEEYDRKAADLQTIQSEISREVAEKLRGRLTRTQEQQLVKRATQNPEAYQLYLNGLFYYRKGGNENQQKALGYLNQAVALDPSFALAYASMPALYVNLAGSSALDPKEAVTKGKAAAEKALELDEVLAEAHNGLAHIKRDEWDWSGAESEFKRAIELNPSLAAAHGSYAQYLVRRGRMTEALAENTRAEELDPLAINFKANEASILYFARRYDEAIQRLQNIIQMQPDYAVAHAYLGSTYASKKSYAEAIDEYQKFISLDGETTSALIYLGDAYAMAGKRNEALAALNKLKMSKEFVSPAGLAIIYAG